MPDLTALLSGAAIAAIIGTIAGTIGTTLLRNVQTTAVRQGYRKLRRSQGFKDIVVVVITLLPYIVAGGYLYTRSPKLAGLMLASIGVSWLVGRTHHRFTLRHILMVLALALAAWLWTRTPWGPGVVLATTVFREAWAKVRGFK
jgi:hypothetical protein